MAVPSISIYVTQVRFKAGTLQIQV